MTLETVEIDGRTTKVVLTGRMDIAGAREVDIAFALISNSKRNLVVDMTAVSFLASMGLRTLLSAARNVTMNGGRLVLFNPYPDVEKVLIVSGTSDVMPIYGDFADACAAVR